MTSAEYQLTEIPEQSAGRRPGSGKWQKLLNDLLAHPGQAARVATSDELQTNRVLWSGRNNLRRILPEGYLLNTSKQADGAYFWVTQQGGAR